MLGSVREIGASTTAQTGLRSRPTPILKFMQTAALIVLAVAEVAVTILLVIWRDRKYAFDAAAWFLTAGISGIAITRFQTGSLRTAVLVPVSAYPAWVVTRFRPGVMFTMLERESSEDPAVRDATRRAERAFAFRLVAAALGAVAILTLLNPGLF